MPTVKSGGFGAELFGDPYGSGGPLTVLRARAVAGQVVRVTFSEEPLHRSPAGVFDALNPANYSLAVLVGQVSVVPSAVGVDPLLVLPPTLAVTGATNATPIVITTVTPHPYITGSRVFIIDVLGNAAANGSWTVTKTGDQTFSLNGSVGSGVYGGGGLINAEERSVDVHFDRQLVVGLTYRVGVVNVRSRFSGGLGTPTTADFVGVVQQKQAVKPRRDPTLVDIANNIVLGAFLVDDSGDLQIQSGLDSLRKRVVRRLLTPKGAFSFLPDYGVGLVLKELANPGQLAAFKTDARQQIRQEPEVADATVNTTLLPQGVLFVAVQVATRTGSVVELQMTRSSDGTVLT